MSILPWVIVAVETVILIALAVRGYRRASAMAAALRVLAKVPPPLSGPEQVEALTKVFTDVIHTSEYGGRLDEFASAALTWMRQQQRGGTP